MANPLERVEELFGGAVGNFSGPGGTGGFSPSQEHPNNSIKGSK